VSESNEQIVESSEQMVLKLIEMTSQSTLSFEQATDLIRVNRNIERVAECATSISEEALFCAENRLPKCSTEKGYARCAEGESVIGVEDIRA
jgi:phosphate uptake regulator